MKSLFNKTNVLEENDQTKDYRRGLTAFCFHLTHPGAQTFQYLPTVHIEISG